MKGRVKLTEGRPLDRNAVEQSPRRASIRCTSTRATTPRRSRRWSCRSTTAGSGSCSTCNEGSRVAISQVAVEGNKHFTDEQVVKHMATRPEGFWWFQKGEYDEDKLEQDVRERLPALVRRPRLHGLPGHSTTR